MNDNNEFFQGISDGIGNIFDVIINLGGEFGVINDVLLVIIVPAVGILISMSAVLDLTKMKNPRYAQKVTPGSVAIRFVIGPTTILLTSFMLMLSQSIFGDVVPDEVPTAFTYTDNISEGTDPTAGLFLAITGFLVLVGWISGLRAMMAFARIGNPQENGFQQFKTGASRLVAASFLCMFQFFMDDLIVSFLGTEGGYSSALNL